MVDGGPRLGAEGEVTVEGGAPSTYTVAPGDVHEAIADRFGLTLGDLRFLNPTRGMRGTDTSIVYEGEELNLDRTAR